MRRKLKKKKGLTLLELIIVLGLMGIVTAIVFSFVNTTQRKSKELEIRQELQFEGTMITESMMGNVLEMKNIIRIENDLSNTTDENKITEIEFQLGAIGQYKNSSELNRISRIKYVVDSATKELQLQAFQLDSRETDLESNNGQWKLASVVSRYVKEVRIENAKIVEFLNDSSKNSIEELNKLLEKEKSVNLKVVLEDDYYNEKIEHAHTIELSLRNAR